MADAARTCAACGGENGAVAQFCQHCGSPLAATDGGEQRKVVTVVFCDVTGSTALGERLDPEILRSVMGAFYERARQVIDRHEGTLEKFIGDAVLAVFGVPVAREDDALRAVRAAADIQDAVADLAVEIQRQHGIGLGVRIGVNTGEVIVGRARSGGSFATGDAVNTAARLEQAAQPGETLLGDTTFALVRAEVTAQPVEPMVVRGKAEALPAWRLQDVTAASGPRAMSESPLVGRDRERRMLDEALARVIDSETAAVVTVLGDAGLGKTRLVGDFLDGAAARARVLQGRCLSYGDGIAFFPLVEVVRQAVGLSGTDSAETIDAALRDAMGEHPAAATVVRQLAPLVGAGGEPGRIDDVTWALLSLLERLVDEQAVVLVVDDVHWAQPALLDLLDALVRRSRDLPVLTVVAARPEFVVERSDWGAGFPNGVTLQLEPLTHADAEDLISALGVDRTLADRISETAGGNPLFLEQLAAHVGADGVAGDVPPTIRALLTARLDQLEERERRVVGAASVIGQIFRVDELSALTGQDADNISGTLDALVARQVIRRSRQDGSGAYRFRHALVQDAAYDAQPKAERARFHAAFAEWLDGHRGEAGTDDDAVRAYHLERAAQLLSELGSSRSAQEARREASEALEAVARRREITDWGEAALLLGRAAALRDDDVERAKLLIRGATDAVEGLRYTQVGDAYDVAEELAIKHGAHGVAATAAAGRLVVQGATTTNVTADAIIGACRQAHDAALADGYPAGAMLACRFEGFGHNVRGQWADLLAALRRLADIAAAHGETAWYAQGRRSMAACVRWGTTPAAEAIEIIRGVEAEFAYAPGSLANMRLHLAVVLALVGDTEGALEALGEQPPEDELSRVVTWAFAAVWTYRYLGRDGAAIAARAAELSEVEDNLAHASTLWGLAAMLGAEAGDERARAWMERGRETSPPDDSTSQGGWRCAAALLGAGTEPAGTVREHVRLATYWMDQSDQINESAEIRRLCSMALRRTGDGAAADQLLREALDLFEAKGNVVMAARCRQELGLDEFQGSDATSSATGLRGPV